jgi:cytochrome b561
VPCIILLPTGAPVIQEQAKMNWKNTPQRYGSLSIGLHWLMLLLFIAVFASIELSGVFPKGSDSRATMKALHFSLGLLVFFMGWLRLAMRFLSPVPPFDQTLPRWQQLAAGMTHVMLYGLMIGMPLLGWLALSAAGKPIPFFGLEFSSLITENDSLAKPLKKLHETIGSAAYLLIGMHAAAALFHHYVRGDDSLRKMLPERS